jgi:propanol-preferring alcohol dehydrogenase
MKDLRPPYNRHVQAVVLDHPHGTLRLEQRAAPEATTDDDSVVSVRACGVCHSDLHVVDGSFSGTPYPLVLGHEVAGEVDGLGNVLVYTPWGCGQCRFCAAGEEMICPDGREAGLFQDGGYAEWMLVPHRRYLLPIGDLDPVTAAPLGCGGLTAYRAVKHALPWLGEGRRALILGAGGLGQFAIQYVRFLSDSEVVVGDPSAQKRERAVELGAESAADPGDLDGPFDVVLDFVGAQDSLETAARLVDRKGLLAVMGLFGGRVPFGLGAVPHEAHLMSSIWGSLAELAELIELARREPLQYTIEKMPLAEAQAAHDRLRSGEAKGRLVLVP